MRILTEDTVGLVIDIQERLLPHISEHQDLLKRTYVLLEGLQLLDLPIILTEQYRKGLGPTVAGIQEKIARFNPLEKMSFSCCDDKGFSEELKKQSRRNIIICGIEAHVCVLQTAMDLIADGYQPVIIADCISSRKLSDKEIAIERMRQEGAIISSVESILFELTRISGTDTFKKISHLLK